LDARSVRRTRQLADKNRLSRSIDRRTADRLGATPAGFGGRMATGGVASGVAMAMLRSVAEGRI